MNRRRGVIAVAVVIAAACTDAGTDAPFTMEPATVAVTLEFGAGASAGGPRAAYFRTDRLELRFRDGSNVREQHTADFAPADDATHVPVLVRLRSPTEEMMFELELRLGAAAVFRGSTPVVLRAGRTTAATVTLQPVVASIAGPGGVPVLSAYGDTLELAGASLFVTGDTIDAAAAVSWTSLDPGVASVDDDGTVVARADGLARVVARLDGFADTVMVEVLAEVADVDVSPSGQIIPIGATRQYTAIPRDRRGNAITGRSIIWSTSDASVLAVDQMGVARGVGVGSARIIARVDEADGEAIASAAPGPPLTQDLTVTLGSSPITAVFAAGVWPNGGRTDIWFEWAPVSTAAQLSLTLKRDIGAGVLRVPVGTTVQGLLPATTYEVRIVATNSAGRHESEAVFFTTGLAPPSVKTLPASGSTPPFVTLNGTANANGSPATVWFEWGADSTAATISTTPQSISGATSGAMIASVPSGPIGTTWYYRIAASNAAGTTKGAFLSWTTQVTPFASPLATTNAASGQGDVKATLNGTAVPNGSAASAWFEYGTDPALSVFTSTTMQAVGSGSTPVAFSENVTGLLLYQQTYYFRAVVRNAHGTTRGAIVAIN